MLLQLLWLVLLWLLLLLLLRLLLLLLVLLRSGSDQVAEIIICVAIE